MGRHRMPPHPAFSRVAAKLLHHEPPCQSEAEDWEGSAGFLAEEHLALPSAKQRQSTPDRLHLERTLTLQSGGWGWRAAWGAGGVPDGWMRLGDRKGCGCLAGCWGGAGGPPCASLPASSRARTLQVPRQLFSLHTAHLLLAPADEAGLNTGLRSEGVTSLRRAWESSQRSTKEDWAEWMRNFSIELLKQSPSRALRACAALAQTNPGMARELFAAGFVSCWSELDEQMQASWAAGRPGEKCVPAEGGCRHSAAGGGGRLLDPSSILQCCPPHFGKCT